MWYNLHPKELYLSKAQVDAGLSWVLANHTAVAGVGAAHPSSVVTSKAAQVFVPLFFGYSQPDYLSLQPNKSFSFWRQTLLNLRGDNVSILGGEARDLSSADSLANLASGAAEAQLSRLAQQLHTKASAPADLA